MEEHEDKDTAESSSRCSAQLCPSPEDSSIIMDDDFESLSVLKGKANINKTKHLQLMAALSQNKQKVRRKARWVIETDREYPRNYITTLCPYQANGRPFSHGSLLHGLICLDEQEELKYELK